MPVRGSGWPAVTRPYGLAIGAVVLAGALIRIASADYSPWFDELASVFFADKPIGTLWSSWIVRETNPPLYYSMLRGWIALFGHGVRALRGLSVVGGLLGIVLLIFCALRWYGQRAALAVAVLACFSAQHIHLSQQIRAYVFAFDGVLVSLIGLWLLTRGAGDRVKGIVLYVLGALLAIYCHTTMFLWPVVATLAFTIVFFRDIVAHRWRPLLLLIGANLLVAIGAAWWLVMTMRQLQVSHGNIDWIKPMTIGTYRSTITQTILLLRDPWEWQKGLPIVMAGAAIFGAQRTWANPATRLIVVAGLLAVVIFGLAGMARPIVTSRTVSWMMIFTMLPIAAGIGSIRRDAWRHGVLGGLAAVLLLNLVIDIPQFAPEPWDATIQRVARTPHSVLIVEGEALAVLADYACRIELADRSGCPFPVLAVSVASPTFDIWADGMADRPPMTPAAVRASLAPDARVFFLSRSLYRPLARMQVPGYAQPRPDGGLFELTGPLAASRL